MLIRHLDTVIVDLENKPIMGPSGKPFTLRDAIISALLNEQPQEPGKPHVTGEQRFKLWSIANKVKAPAEEVELTAEEIANIKTKVGEAFLAVVVGPVWTMLESPATGGVE